MEAIRVPPVSAIFRVVSSAPGPTIIAVGGRPVVSQEKDPGLPHRKYGDVTASAPGAELTMCRLFGMTAGTRTASATFWLLDAPDSLEVQSRRNVDGSGIGFFDPSGAPVLDKAPEPAFADEQFGNVAKGHAGWKQMATLLATCAELPSLLEPVCDLMCHVLGTPSQVPVGRCR